MPRHFLRLQLFFFFFFECSGIQFFNFPPVLLTGQHATSVVTRCFPPQPFNVIPYPSVSYHQVFRPILYFQPSSSQSDRDFTLTPNQHLCYLWDTMPRQWSPGASHPLPKEAEDFPRGEKYFRHMPLPTYLIYFSPKGLY